MLSHAAWTTHEHPVTRGLGASTGIWGDASADPVALSRFFHAMEQRSVAEQSSQSRQLGNRTVFIS